MTGSDENAVSHSETQGGTPKVAVIQRGDGVALRRDGAADDDALGRERRRSGNLGQVVEADEEVGHGCIPVGAVTEGYAALARADKPGRCYRRRRHTRHGCSAMPSSDFRLDSDWNPETKRLTLTLVNQGREPLSSFRLAFTSLLRIKGAESVEGGALVEQLSNSHVIAPPDGFVLAPGAAWTVTADKVSHDLRHYTYGPKTAWLILADGREGRRRSDADDPRRRRRGRRRPPRRRPARCRRGRRPSPSSRTRSR